MKRVCVCRAHITLKHGNGRRKSRNSFEINEMIVSEKAMAQRHLYNTNARTQQISYSSSSSSSTSSCSLRQIALRVINCFRFYFRSIDFKFIFFWSGVFFFVFLLLFSFRLSAGICFHKFVVNAKRKT